MALHAEGVFSFAESTEDDVAFLSTPSNPRNHPAPRQRGTFSEPAKRQGVLWTWDISSRNYQISDY